MQSHILRKTLLAASSECWIERPDPIISQETTDEQSRTYLFEPGSFRPLARIDQTATQTGQAASNSNQIYYYHLNHLGTPERRVALRHANRPQDGQSGDVVVTGNLKVDLNKSLVSVDDREIHLTPIQFRLLAVLIRHTDRVMTHRQILKEVWGPSYQENAHYLRIYMSQLRQKLETDPTQPKHLLTESDVGYRFKI